MIRITLLDIGQHDVAASKNPGSTLANILRNLADLVDRDIGVVPDYPSCESWVSEAHSVGTAVVDIDAQ